MLLLNPFRFGGGAGFLPTDIASLVRWWDADDAASLTVVSLEVTSWLDQVASANLVKDVNGPAEVTVNGVNFLAFDRTNSERLTISGDTAVDPGGDDVTYVVAFRVVSNTQGALFGKIGGGDPDYNFGMFVNVAAAGSLYWQMRDDITANTLILEDTATDWGDNVVHVAAFSYNDGLGDAHLYMDDLAPRASAYVARNLAYASNAIVPTDPFYVGNWDTGTNHLTFDICDLMVFDAELSDGDMQDVQDYLSAKHSLSL